APLAFGFSFSSAVAGMVLWGIGMGAQESILRAAVARMIPSEKRGTAYGLFNAGYGIAWFAGSALMGRLYDVSLTALILFSMVTQFVAIVILLGIRRELR
ncbi:MAG TPA: MFS transporter, partial [Acidobacteriota bacterium]|nr:MFS transporter [Acidobacteriota bacterium]